MMPSRHRSCDSDDLTYVSCPDTKHWQSDAPPPDVEPSLFRVKIDYVLPVSLSSMCIIDLRFS